MTKLASTRNARILAFSPLVGQMPTARLNSTKHFVTAMKIPKVTRTMSTRDVSPMSAWSMRIVLTIWLVSMKSVWIHAIVQPMLLALLGTTLPIATAFPVTEGMLTNVDVQRVSLLIVVIVVCSKLLYF